MTNINAPPRYKLALLTWAAAFPLLTAVNVLLRPLLVALPLPGRTLLMTGLLVGLLTYVIMPRLTRLCASWLAASAHERPGESVVPTGTFSQVQNHVSSDALKQHI